jgi:hypothetical protein
MDQPNAPIRRFGIQERVIKRSVPLTTAHDWSIVAERREVDEQAQREVVRSLG